MDDMKGTTDKVKYSEDSPRSLHPSSVLRTDVPLISRAYFAVEFALDMLNNER